MPDARPRSNSKFFTGNGMWAGYSYGASAPASTLSTPTLTLTTANLTYPPQFSVGLDDTYNVAQSDALTLIGRNKAGTIIYTFGPHIVTLAEATAVPPAAIFTGLSAVSSGTTRWTVFGQRPGQGVSANSNQIAQGPDDQEAILSLPTTGTIGSTSIIYGFTTDTAEGTAYTVFTLTNSQPTALQVEAGQDSAGVAASFATSALITATGAQAGTATGLSSSTVYYRWHQHKDVAGNRSAVLGGGAATTLAPASSIATLWSGAAGVNRRTNITVSNFNLTATVNADVGAPLYVRSTDVPPSKFHFEITIDSFRASGTNVYVGVVDSARDLSATFALPGDSTGAKGLTLPLNTGNGTTCTFSLNGATTTATLPSAPVAGHIFSFDVNTLTNVILVKVKISGTVTTVGTYTLTSQIPTVFTAFGGGSNSVGANSDGLTFNFGATAFAITPATGHTGW